MFKEKMYLDDLNITLDFETAQINIISITHYPFKPNKIIPNHRHGIFELHFINSGKGIVKIADETYTLKKGMFYLTAPEVFHEQIADAEAPMEEFGITFDFIKTPHTHEGKNTFSDAMGLFDRLTFFIGKDDFDCISLCDRIFIEQQNRYLGYYENIKNCSYQILLYTMRYIIKNSISENSIPTQDLNSSRRRILDDIFAYRYASMTLAGTAKALGISSRHLDRVVKHYYAMSFKDKLLQVRIEQGKFLLKNTLYSVQEISDNLGFSSANYFARIFKKKTGKKPSELRSNTNH